MNITLITRDDCGYCLMAKEALHQKNLDYKERKIGEDIRREEVLELVEAHGLGNLLPIVIIDGEYHNYSTFIDRINS